MNATTQSAALPERDHALSNALAWFESIQEMLAVLNAAHEAENGHPEIDDEGNEIPVGLTVEDAERTIHESVLSVEVRSAWHVPGSLTNDGDWGSPVSESPAEYRILLSTGGPACQITGTLSERGEPETATLQTQDWFKPWSDVSPASIALATQPKAAALSLSAVCAEIDAVLLAFARQFYFGG